jgi:hypothetical protein
MKVTKLFLLFILVHFSFFVPSMAKAEDDDFESQIQIDVYQKSCNLFLQALEAPKPDENKAVQFTLLNRNRDAAVAIKVTGIFPKTETWFLEAVSAFLLPPQNPPSFTDEISGSEYMLIAPENKMTFKLHKYAEYVESIRVGNQTIQIEDTGAISTSLIFNEIPEIYKDLFAGKLARWTFAQSSRQKYFDLFFTQVRHRLGQYVDHLQSRLENDGLKAEIKTLNETILEANSDRTLLAEVHGDQMSMKEGKLKSSYLVTVRVKPWEPQQ